MTPLKPITVLLADDHAIVRQGLGALLHADGHFKMLGEAKTGREAVDLATELRPDVILMDIAMPVLNGLEATRQILAANPAARHAPSHALSRRLRLAAGAPPPSSADDDRPRDDRAGRRGGAGASAGPRSRRLRLGAVSDDPKRAQGRLVKEERPPPPRRDSQENIANGSGSIAEAGSDGSDGPLLVDAWA